MKCGHILLRDTRGNFYLGIRLPTKDYRPRRDRRQQDRLYRQRHPERVKEARRKWRVKNPKYHVNYSRQWKKRLPFKRKEYYRLQKLAYMKTYYKKNRQHILDYHRQLYRNRKKKAN